MFAPFSHAAHSGTDPAPPQGGAQADIFAEKPFNEGDFTLRQHSCAVAHPPSSELKSISSPVLPLLQHKFSTIVSNLSEDLCILYHAQFQSLLVSMPNLLY